MYGRFDGERSKTAVLFPPSKVSQPTYSHSQGMVVTD
jgi:hypothetical protein